MLLNSLSTYLAARLYTDDATSTPPPTSPRDSHIYIHRSRHSTPAGLIPLLTRCSTLSDYPLEYIYILFYTCRFDPSLDAQPVAHTAPPERRRRGLPVLRVPRVAPRLLLGHPALPLAQIGAHARVAYVARAPRRLRAEEQAERRRRVRPLECQQWEEVSTVGRGRMR